MPLKRPYIPLKVKLAVLMRQAYVDRQFESDDEREAAQEWYRLCCHGRSVRARINWLLQLLFHGEKVQLDHDPALELRVFNRNTGKYKPDANDPNFMVYRLPPDHLRKTTGRSIGAAVTVTSKGSDTWLAKKFRKLEHPKKSRSRIQSRPFPKTKRPMRSRSSFATRAEKGS